MVEIAIDSSILDKLFVVFALIVDLWWVVIIGGLALYAFILLILSMFDGG